MIKYKEIIKKYFDKLYVNKTKIVLYIVLSPIMFIISIIMILLLPFGFILMLTEELLGGVIENITKRKKQTTNLKKVV